MPHARLQCKQRRVTQITTYPHPHSLPALSPMTRCGLTPLTTPAPAPVRHDQEWLNKRVDLPGGYRTSRRDVLRLTSLAAGVGCFWVAGTRAKAMSFASPQALLNALMPPPVRGRHTTRVVTRRA